MAPARLTGRGTPPGSVRARHGRLCTLASAGPRCAGPCADLSAPPQARHVADSVRCRPRSGPRGSRSPRPGTCPTGSRTDRSVRATVEPPSTTRRPGRPRSPPGIGGVHRDGPADGPTEARPGRVPHRRRAGAAESRTVPGILRDLATRENLYSPLRSRAIAGLARRREDSVPDLLFAVAADTDVEESARSLAAQALMALGDARAPDQLHAPAAASALRPCDEGSGHHLAGPYPPAARPRPPVRPGLLLRPGLRAPVLGRARPGASRCS